MTSPYQYTISDNSIFCLAFLIAGIFNSFFLGTILDKYQNYKTLNIIICFGSAITIAFLAFALPLKSRTLLTTVMALIGAFLIPMLSVGYAYAVELAYPLPEPLINGMLATGSLLWGAVLVRTMQL